MLSVPIKDLICKLQIVLRLSQIQYIKNCKVFLAIKSELLKLKLSFGIIFNRYNVEKYNK